jgi:hypothetical protein
MVKVNISNKYFIKVPIFLIYNPVKLLRPLVGAIDKKENITAKIIKK